MWTYRCYDNERPINLWQKWYDDNPDFQGSHDAIFRLLEQRETWGGLTCVDFLDKKERVIEVRLTGKVKHRILGSIPEKGSNSLWLAPVCTSKRSTTPMASKRLR